MARPSSGLAALLVVAVALAGCATTKPPAAVTGYARRDCAAEPELSKAVSLTPDKAKPAFVVTTPVRPETACLARSGGAAPYVLYALPADVEGKTLTVGAVLEPARVLAPEISILDRQGRAMRTFPTSEFLFRGSVYSVQFRPKAGEAYVLVAADPAQVGKGFNSIEIGTNTTTVSTGYATANWRSGVDKTVSRTFSYEGLVQVTVFDSKAKTGR